ncbi:hypothetical protein BAE44_0005753, partial [Dichanthelium oligosanthes]
GWHSEWFYVSNPPPSLLRFSGHFAQKIDEWDWATGKDEKRVWLTPVEVRAHVWVAIKRSKDVADDVAELDRHQHGLAPEPAAKREGLDPPIALRGRPCYPPLPKAGLRDVNRAKNERQRALSQQKKKLKADQARRHMLRQQGRLSDESEEEDDDDEGDDGGDDDDDEGRYEAALGLGKRPAEEGAGVPSPKRLRADPGQGAAGEGPSSGLGPDQPGDAPISAVEVPQSTETAPTGEAGAL